MQGTSLKERSLGPTINPEANYLIWHKSDKATTKPTH